MMVLEWGNGDGFPVLGYLVFFCRFRWGSGRVSASPLKALDGLNPPGTCGPLCFTKPRAVKIRGLAYLRLSNFRKTFLNQKFSCT